MKKALYLVLLTLSGPVWGQAKKKEPTPVALFTIQGKSVSSQDFIYLYKKNHLKADDFTEQKVQEYIDLFIQFKLKVREAEARGMDTTASFKKEFSTYKEELKKPYTAEKGELDRLAKEAYQRKLEEVNASHILIGVKVDATPADTLASYNKIMAVRERILKGEAFEKVAAEVSEDPTAKTNGGSLGYFTVFQMVYPFETAAYQLKAGEVSMPVRSRFGYHLVKVVGRKPAQGQVEVSHILLRATGDDTKVRNKIFEIEDQLQGGRSWDELCKEYSDDISSRETGGRLRPFGIGELAAVPEFEAVAFSLKEPKEVSDPFKSSYGWHIVRLEKKIPVPPYNEEEPNLKRRVARDERLAIAGKKILVERKKKFGFTEDLAAKKELFASVDTTLRKGRWKFRGSEALKGRTLFSISDQRSTAGMFIAYAEKNQAENALQPDTYFESLYGNFVTGKLNAVEEEELIRDNPEFRTMLNEYREGILLFTIMEIEVWNKASKDSAGQKGFYNTHTQRYSVGNRVSAKIFATPDKAFFEEVMKKVNAGDSIKKETIKRFKSATTSRNYEKGDNKALDKVSWTLGGHTTELDGTYYLIDIDNLVAPGTKSFEEARATVISDYQDLLEKNWVAQLKLKYPVKVNNKGKKFVISELTKK